MPPRVPRDGGMTNGREAVRPVLDVWRGGRTLACGEAAGKLAGRFGPAGENNGRRPVYNRMRRAAHHAGLAGPVYGQGRGRRRIAPAGKRRPGGRGAREAARTRIEKRTARRWRGGRR